MPQRRPRREDWQGLEELRGDLERSLARACRDRNALDDLVQETLLRAASRRDGLEHPELLRPWLLRIAWNVMRDQHRRSRRARGQESPDELLAELPERPPADEGPRVAAELRLGARTYEGGEVHDLLCHVLPELSLEDRRLFDAYYRQGRGCGLIASDLGVSPQTVKMRLFRLRRRVLRRLSRRSALELTPLTAGGGVA
jgi:RNA polymerase sigma-70 factor (ECF subfamily)